MVSKENIEEFLTKQPEDNVVIKYGTLIPDALGRIISGFANTTGGTLIIGYSFKKNKVFGCSGGDDKLIRRIIESIENPPQNQIYYVDYQNHSLLIVEIMKNSKLSFQQILILTTIGFFQIAGETIRNTPLKTTAYNMISDVRKMSIAVDIYSLYREGLLQSSSVVFDPPGITPANLSVRGLGALLYDLMELSSLPLENRIEDIVDYLTDGNYSKQIMLKNDV